MTRTNVAEHKLNAVRSCRLDSNHYTFDVCVGNELNSGRSTMTLVQVDHLQVNSGAKANRDWRNMGYSEAWTVPANLWAHNCDRKWVEYGVGGAWRVRAHMGKRLADEGVTSRGQHEAVYNVHSVYQYGIYNKH